MLDEEDSTTMKRHRHTPEQIVRKLREGERLLNEGKDLAEVLRHLEVSEQTWHRWRNQYGGWRNQYGGWIGPVSGDQLPVPADESRRGDEVGRPPLSRQ